MINDVKFEEIIYSISTQSLTANKKKYDVLFTQQLIYIPKCAK